MHVQRAIKVSSTGKKAFPEELASEQGLDEVGVGM